MCVDVWVLPRLTFGDKNVESQYVSVTCSVHIVHCDQLTSAISGPVAVRVA